jgi:asparagine synthase (glutamine-hydrolysing)
MCGIAGLLACSSVHDTETLTNNIARMTGTLAHRGPDADGLWVDPEKGIALGHRRLSIIDLTAMGQQPMLSYCERYVLVFNGEIYNHLALRRELETNAGFSEIAWRGHSDTETLLTALSVWGPQVTLEKLVGMYAFALYDRLSRRLLLARDRLGEKPLYYGWQGDIFLFGSELKALRAHSSFHAEIDRNALTLLLRLGYIPAPYSIYQGIRKLPPGSYLMIGTKSQTEEAPQAYWSLRQIADEGQQTPFPGSEREAMTELDRLLRQTIAGQMVAEVPLGAFLSGGLDSSTIVALMQAQSSVPIKTYTIGFGEKEYNEAEYADAVARHLGTEHTTLYVTPEQALAVIPRLPEIYDEPFADPSQIPTFLVAQLTRRHVTVSLSGDGGDELFGGYQRYFWARNIWRGMSWVPHGTRTTLTRILTRLPPEQWSAILGIIYRFLPRRLRYANPGDRLHKLAALGTMKTPMEVYRELISHWKRPDQVVLGAIEPPSPLLGPSHIHPQLEFEQRMMFLDTETYLADDILVKVDRAAMSVSLETRVPLLDHRIVEFAWRLPLSMKIRHGQGKWLLRQVLYQYLPPALVDRPKMGFGVPLDSWLRGPLRDWAEALLDSRRLQQEGFFDPAPIRQRWLEHQSGQRNWSYYLWDVLMFQAWRETQAAV